MRGYAGAGSEQKQTLLRLDEPVGARQLAAVLALDRAIADILEMVDITK